MASARAGAAGAAVARPRPRPEEPRARRPSAAEVRRRARSRARSRTGILWIVVGGFLLAGVVFVNLAVLRLNLRLDSATTLRNKLRADNAALQSELSSSLASPRIQTLASKHDGLVQADASSIVYLDLGKR